jgi:hypothetical protein
MESTNSKRLSTIFHEAVKDNFWTTPLGIDQRLAMFSEDFSYNVLNNSLQIYGGANDVWGFEWTGIEDSHTCKICEPKIGNQYQKGAFLPSLPAHNHCRCSWELIQK